MRKEGRRFALVDVSRGEVEYDETHEEEEAVAMAGKEVLDVREEEGTKRKLSSNLFRFVGVSSLPSLSLLPSRQETEFAQREQPLETLGYHS